MTATRSGNVCRSSIKSNKADRPPPTKTTSYSRTVIHRHSTLYRRKPSHSEHYLVFVSQRRTSYLKIECLGRLW